MCDASKSSCVLNLYVNWKCKIKFVKNNGTWNVNNNDYYIAKFDNIFYFSQLPSLPTRSGYKLDGWHVGSADSDTIYRQYIDNNSECGKTLYANWVPNNPPSNCTVKFYANGGSWSLGSPYTRTYTSKFYFSSLPSLPTRSGYTLNGWRVGSSTSSTIYSNYIDNSVCGISLYANWVKKYQINQ